MDSENHSGLPQVLSFGSSRARRTQAHASAYFALVGNGELKQDATADNNDEDANGNNKYNNYNNNNNDNDSNDSNDNKTNDKVTKDSGELESPFDEAALSNLSANFSSESLVGSLGNSNVAAGYPLGIGSMGSPYVSRRYSNKSLANSPVLTTLDKVWNSKRHSRPKSGIFMMDTSNFAISEDGSPIQDAIDNTPRARTSFVFGNGSATPSNSAFGNGNSNRNSTAAQAYVPTAPIAPPTRPNGFLFGGSGDPSRSNSRSTSPVRSLSPSRLGRSISPIRKPETNARQPSPQRYQPFNFQPQELMINQNNISGGGRPAHRKGHKYKHSSVTMNLFQEPPPAIKTLHNQVLKISELYPIPTFKESLNSISQTQNLKLIWSIGHVFLSVFIFLIGMKYKLPSLLTLAHLVFYDALGSLVIAFVDIMSNFEVWNSSSIQYPFGLGRLEVLVGFALSSSLIMVALDLISHSVEEFIVELAVGGASEVSDHLLHHIHGEHDSNGTVKNWLVYETILILTMFVTFVSSNYILFYDRITKMISNNTTNGGGSEKTKSKTGILEAETSNQSSLINSIIGYWNSMSKNPTHFLTLAYTTYLMSTPLLPTQLGLDLDVDLNEATTLIVALFLCYNGWKIAKSLGGILLLSYPHSDYQYLVLKLKIADGIEQLDCFKTTYSINRLFITKFNYELFVVGMGINMFGGTNEEESKIRFEANRIVKALLEEQGSGKKNKIEITIDIDTF